MIVGSGYLLADLLLAHCSSGDRKPLVELDKVLGSARLGYLQVDSQQLLQLLLLQAWYLLVQLPLLPAWSLLQGLVALALTCYSSSPQQCPVLVAVAEAVGSQYLVVFLLGNAYAIPSMRKIWARFYHGLWP